MKLKDNFIFMAQVGSSVTCNPPVTDTDIDFLCQIQEGKLEEVHNLMLKEGWVCNNNKDYGPPDEYKERKFMSYRKGKINYIITWSKEYKHKFMVATAMAKQFNLLNKADRVTLFNYVLYGEEPE